MMTQEIFAVAKMMLRTLQIMQSVSRRRLLKLRKRTLARITGIRKLNDKRLKNSRSQIPVKKILLERRHKREGVNEAKKVRKLERERKMLGKEKLKQDKKKTQQGLQ